MKWRIVREVLRVVVAVAIALGAVEASGECPAGVFRPAPVVEAKPSE